jgi:hypothetical protein
MGRRVLYIRPQASPYLPLTTAWVAVTGETDTTILNALNTFEASLIANGMTSDLIAYWPMVGGTALKHSYNFMNTSLYQLIFLGGGWTHSATGALPNGTSSYADTQLNANTVLTQNNSHISFYSRTNTATASRTSIGAYIGAGNITYAIQLKKANNANAYNCSQTAGQVASVANANTQGFYLNNKTSASIGGLTLDKNGTQIAANLGLIIGNTYPDANILISALINMFQFDDKECAGATVGLGLNSTKRAQLASMINTLNTSLSRNVY